MRGRPTKLEDERKVRLLKPKIPGYRYEYRAPSVTVIWGRYPVGDDNPGGVKASRCHGCKSHHKPPKLLVRHHLEPYELWFCQGCGDVLIKAKVKEHNDIT